MLIFELRDTCGFGDAEVVPLHAQHDSDQIGGICTYVAVAWTPNSLNMCVRISISIMCFV